MSFKSPNSELRTPIEFRAACGHHLSTAFRTLNLRGSTRSHQHQYGACLQCQLMTDGGKRIRKFSKDFVGGDIFLVGHRDFFLGLFGRTSSGSIISSGTPYVGVVHIKDDAPCTLVQRERVPNIPLQLH